MKISHLGWNFLKGPEKKTNKPPVTRHEHWYLQDVDMGFLGTRESTQVIAIVYGCPWEVEGKNCMLKIPGTSDTSPEVPDMELTWIPPQWDLVALEPEGTMKAFKRGKQPTVLPNFNDSETQWPVC